MANSVDPDQSGAVWSVSPLFAKPICPKTQEHYGTNCKQVTLFEPLQNKTNKMTCAPSQD